MVSHYASKAKFYNENSVIYVYENFQVLLFEISSTRN